jgi:hypothetical protein
VTLAGWAIVALAALLALGVLQRVRRATREHDFGRVYDRLRRADAQEALAHLAAALHEQRASIAAYAAATRARDLRRLRAACAVVEDVLPDLREGRLALKAMLRAVSVIVPLAPTRSLPRQAWRLRGLGKLTSTVPCVVASGMARLRLRLWLLGRATVWSLRRLRTGAERLSSDPRLWEEQISGAIADLGLVGEETAAATYERVVRTLDSVVGGVV